MSKRKSRKSRTSGSFYLFKALIERPALIFLALAVWGGWYAFETHIVRPQRVYMGVPQARDWQQPLTWFRVLRNDGFMLGYSDLRGVPLWVSYALRPIPENAPHYKRPSQFSKDWRGINRVTQDDYKRSGYDRGHMAPNYAISRLYGQEAQQETFLMTNIAPQKPNLNQKLWQRLESVESDYFAPWFGTVWVLAGPVFSGSVERLRSAWNVEIPDAFYKIYAVPGTLGQPPRLLAFIMPQNVRGNESLMQYTVSVDQVEALTGLDFFADLPDAVEQRAEATVDANSWRLQQVAKLPSRY
ncbi:MAG: DNA/RNA non-specific endonuclease [Gammaproteobacteria bacterium]